MPTDQLSRTFAALADPTRRAMLARLSSGAATVGQLAEPFDLTFAAISKHLRVLETAGLVSRGKDAQYRPAQLDARPLAEARRARRRHIGDPACQRHVVTVCVAGDRHARRPPLYD